MILCQKTVLTPSFEGTITPRKGDNQVPGARNTSAKSWPARHNQINSKTLNPKP